MYGSDLLGAMWRGEVTPRFVGVRAINLPPGSAVWRALGEGQAWTDGDYLLAAAVDALNGANWQRAGGKDEKPKPVMRPADAKQERSRNEERRANARAFRERATRQLAK